MISFSRAIQLIFFSGVFSSLVLLSSIDASAIPVGDAYETGQAEFQVSPGFQPRNDTPPVFHPSLHPSLNNEINEAHPIPDYIKKFSKSQPFPIYYQQLLEIDPEDQIQSKVFDEQAFRLIRKIGVLSFENKTADPFKDENAGNVVAKQVSRELQSMTNYSIIPPLMTNEDVRLKIVTELPIDKTNQAEPSSIMNQPVTPDIPRSNDEIDAVMIGAVTKYMNSYRARNGEIKSSLSSRIEFGSFLVSTHTGNVLWGARFVGTQPTGLLSSGPKWLSKEQLSKKAMKKVLKAFHENSKDYNQEKYSP